MVVRGLLHARGNNMSRFMIAYSKNPATFGIIKRYVFLTMVLLNLIAVCGH